MAYGKKLEDIKVKNESIEQAVESKAPAEEPAEKPVSKMNKTELLALAKERDVEVEESATVADLRKALA